MVGSLKYWNLTRPEISHSVNLVCQHMHAPQATRFAAVKENSEVSQGNSFPWLVIYSWSFGTSAYAFDRRSTTGFCLFLGSNLVCWSAKRQPTVARSSTKAEYRALAQSAANISWRP